MKTITVHLIPYNPMYIDNMERYTSDLTQCTGRHNKSYYEII